MPVRVGKKGGSLGKKKPLTVKNGCCCYLVSLNHSTFHIFTDALNCQKVKGGSCWPGGIWRCNGGKCWCTECRFFHGAVLHVQHPPIIDKLQQKCLALGNCLWFPVDLIPLTWNWSNIQCTDVSRSTSLEHVQPWTCWLQEGNIAHFF